MNPIGFSTGALALGDFRAATEMLRAAGVRTIEVSALRYDELHTVVEAISWQHGAGDVPYDLSMFDYVSMHGPSRLVDVDAERHVCNRHQFANQYGWCHRVDSIDLVMHPDTLTDFDLWSITGRKLLLENMDTRKSIGQTAMQLVSFRDKLPSAGFCIDLGHARQVDPTMQGAMDLLRLGGVRQLHLSEVDPFSKHWAMSDAALSDFRDIRDFIPYGVPIILESPVAESDLLNEIDKVKWLLRD